MQLIKSYASSVRQLPGRDQFSSGHQDQIEQKVDEEENRGAGRSGAMAMLASSKPAERKSKPEPTPDAPAVRGCEPLSVFVRGATRPTPQPKPLYIYIYIYIYIYTHKYIYSKHIYIYTVYIYIYT